VNKSLSSYSKRVGSLTVKKRFCIINKIIAGKSSVSLYCPRGFKPYFVEPGSFIIYAFKSGDKLLPIYIAFTGEPMPFVIEIIIGNMGGYYFIPYPVDEIRNFFAKKMVSIKADLKVGMG
jgi:hypothetical protein